MSAALPKMVADAIKNVKLAGIDPANVPATCNCLVTLGLGRASDWILHNRETYLEAVRLGCHVQEEQPMAVPTIEQTQEPSTPENSIQVEGSVAQPMPPVIRVIDTSDIPEEPMKIVAEVYAQPDDVSEPVEVEQPVEVAQPAEAAQAVDAPPPQEPVPPKRATRKTK